MSSMSSMCRGIFSAVAVLGLAMCAQASTESEDKRPNFLFLLADDWGWGDVGAYRPGVSFEVSGTRTQTPGLDALAARGTLFTDFHTGQAFCAPSRTTFMTGRFPADLHVNVNWNVGSKGAPENKKAGLPYQLPTPSGEGPSPYPGGLPNIADVLQKAGYYTAHFGKWHLGGLSPEGEHTPKPSDYGFNMTKTYGSPISANNTLIDDKNQLIGNQSSPWWSADVGDDIRDSGIMAMKAARDAKTPFFIQLWWHMSHDTIDPRPEQLADFPFEETCLFMSKMAGQTICPSQIFWGAQTYSDKERFTPVLDAVKDLGLEDNTYVIFSTDNGAQTHKWHNQNPGAFDNAVGTNGPFRGNKASIYDGGHRVPFIVAGPGVPQGRVDHSLLGAVDWLPTLAALAGAAIPEGTLLRGFDISDILLGKKNNVITRDKPLFWRAAGTPGPCWIRSPFLATRNGDWKLLLNPDYDADPSIQPRNPRVELYNMSMAQLGTGSMNGAFFEAQNLANQYPDVVKSMAKPLLDWHRAVGPRRPNADDHKDSLSTIGCEGWKLPVSKV